MARYKFYIVLYCIVCFVYSCFHWWMFTLLAD